MGKPEFSVANAVDDLRQLVARVDALANAAENLLDGVFWVDHGVDSIKFDRLAHLVGATTDAVQTVMEAGDWLAAELSARRTGDAGDTVVAAMASHHGAGGSGRA
jgi:hypothetical protein